MGAGAIPSASIRSFCMDMEMDEEDRFMFHHIIRAMDRFFLDHCNENGKKKEKAS